jgi:CrcB protein
VDAVDPDLVPEAAGPGPPRPVALLAVAVGGAVGGTTRYEIVAHSHRAAGAFPFAIFVINVAGAFVLGAIVAIASARGPRGTTLRLLVATGFCGGLTTFSTWMLDADSLVRDGHAALAIASIAVSLIAGLAALVAGSWLGTAALAAARR